MRESLNGETAIIEWDELVRHFARGVVVVVDRQLDLIDVATAVASDNTSEVQGWLHNGQLNRASDENAREWNQRKPRFWCVVAAPWVLIQEESKQRSLH